MRDDNSETQKVTFHFCDYPAEYCEECYERMYEDDEESREPKPRVRKKNHLTNHADEPILGAWRLYGNDN